MLWWHHVESLEKLNGLMNYWWNSSAIENTAQITPLESLIVGLLAMKNLTPKQRNAWRAMFDHYLFKQGVDPASYIPEHCQYAIGNMTAEDERTLKNQFIERLKL